MEWENNNKMHRLKYKPYDNSIDNIKKLKSLEKLRIEDLREMEIDVKKNIQKTYKKIAKVNANENKYIRILETLKYERIKKEHLLGKDYIRVIRETDVCCIVKILSKEKIRFKIDEPDWKCCEKTTNLGICSFFLTKYNCIYENNYYEAITYYEEYDNSPEELNYPCFDLILIIPFVSIHAKL